MLLKSNNTKGKADILAWYGAEKSLFSPRVCVPLSFIERE